MMDESLGMGVMIQALSDARGSSDAFRASVGRRIASMALVDDVLRIRFVDGSTLRIEDAGQSCCEDRYMRTDDDLPYFAGAELRGGETRPAPDAGEDHEVQFLVIRTDKGDATFSSHNEHNGYYGGFSIVCSLETPPQETQQGTP